MRRRAVWGGTVGAMVLAVGFGGYFPEYRLNQEIAAAKREGLVVDLNDIQPTIDKSLPQGDNAATLVREAIEFKKAHSILLTGRETDNVLKGTATPEEEAQVRQYYAQNKAFLDFYRRASRMPRMDYRRPWQQGFALLLPEYAAVKNAGKAFAAAAALGIEPKENLLTVARLSVLTRQDPTLIAQMVSVGMGTTALRQAAKLQLGREVEAALGAPIDIRWAYQAEFPSCLDAARRVGTDDWNKSMGVTGEDFWKRLRSMGPVRTNAAASIVHDFREFWKAMPKDGSDYATARRATEQHFDRPFTTLAGMSEVMSKLLGSGDQTQAIDAIQKFADLRKAARAGAPLPPPKPLP